LFKDVKQIYVTLFDLIFKFLNNESYNDASRARGSADPDSERSDGHIPPFLFHGRKYYER